MEEAKMSVVRRLAALTVGLALGLATVQPAFAQETPPPAGSAMAKVTKGMPSEQVQEILGAPTSTNSYPTGKGWIPFYGWWGGDSYRTDFIYKGKGKVIFNQKPFSSRLKVIRVHYDPKEDGF
jgi:hypothetical protein